MNGSRNDGEGQGLPFEMGRMMRLFKALRLEAIERAPLSIRESVLRVVESLETDTRPKSEDLALALMWTMDCRSRELHRRKKTSNPSSKKQKEPKKRDRWGDKNSSLKPSSPSKRAAVPTETVFARRLGEQEEERSVDNSPIRRATRRLKPSSSEN